MPGLDDQQAVEWILVQWIERLYASGMSDTDGQLAYGIALKTPGDVRADRLGQRQLAQAAFDGHLPDAGRRQEHLVAGVLDLPHRGPCQTFRLRVPPQPDLRVEQQ